MQNFPHLIMLRPISTQLDAWSTLRMMMMIMVMIIDLNDAFVKIAHHVANPEEGNPEIHLLLRLIQQYAKMLKWSWSQSWQTSMTDDDADVDGDGDDDDVDIEVDKTLALDIPRRSNSSRRVSRSSRTGRSGTFGQTWWWCRWSRWWRWWGRWQWWWRWWGIWWWFHLPKRSLRSPTNWLAVLLLDILWSSLWWRGWWWLDIIGDHIGKW